MEIPMPMEDWNKEPIELTEMDRQIIVRGLAALSLHVTAYARFEMLASKFEGGRVNFARQRRLLAQQIMPGMARCPDPCPDPYDPLKSNVDFLRGVPDEETGGGLILPVPVMLGREPVRFEVRGDSYIGATADCARLYTGNRTIAMPLLDLGIQDLDGVGAVRFPVTQPEGQPPIDLTTAELFLCFRDTAAEYRLGRVRDAFLPGTNIVQVIGFIAAKDVPAGSETLCR